MRFARVYSAETSLLSAVVVSVEADLSKGLHSFAVVGLPDKAVEEAKDRVSAAVKHSGFTSPKQKNQKIVVSLAPADLKKEGAAFDVAIALAYLLAGGDISFNPEQTLFLGELSLDGKLREIKGVLPLVEHAKRKGFTRVFLPKGNAAEAALVRGISIHGADTLSEIIEHIHEGEGRKKRALPETPPTELSEGEAAEGSFDEVRGQERAKRGLAIAAAGRHNIALFGPPGTGKTMLARAFASLLPPLSFDEVIETTGIHSIAGALDGKPLVRPPLRAPHHTASYASIVGGGTVPRPGEATLAHRGVLFLDEFPEFDRRVIDALRQPLEDRSIAVSRVKGTALFPADFILIAAMNPCPCGHFGSTRECICTPSALSRYRRKISGPIIDRIDLWIEVAGIEHKKLSGEKKAGEHERLKNLVRGARERQAKRFAGHPKKVRANAEMRARDIEQFVPLDEKLADLMNGAAAKLSLSPRSYHRVLKLARTIADLEGSESLKDEHLLEALQYRPREAVS